MNHSVTGRIGVCRFGRNTRVLYMQRASQVCDVFGNREKRAMRHLIEDFKVLLKAPVPVLVCPFLQHADASYCIHPHGNSMCTYRPTVGL